MWCAREAAEWDISSRVTRVIGGGEDIVVCEASRPRCGDCGEEPDFCEA